MFHEAFTEAVKAILIFAGCAAVWLVIQEWVFARFTDDR